MNGYVPATCSKEKSQLVYTQIYIPATCPYVSTHDGFCHCNRSLLLFLCAFRLFFFPLKRSFVCLTFTPESSIYFTERLFRVTTNRLQWFSVCLQTFRARAAQVTDRSKNNTEHAMYTGMGNSSIIPGLSLHGFRRGLG